MGIETVVMATPVSDVQFVAVDLDDPLAAPLLAELSVEYSGRYGGTPERTMVWLTTSPWIFSKPILAPCYLEKESGVVGGGAA